MCVCVCVCVCLYRERERFYFKKLAHAIVAAWKVQNLKGAPTGWRPREELQFGSRCGLLAGFPLPLGSSAFFY